MRNVCKQNDTKHYEMIKIVGTITESTPIKNKNICSY